MGDVTPPTEPLEDRWSEDNRLKRRCPHCGASGLFVHMRGQTSTGQRLHCDACDTIWDWGEL